MLKYSIKRFLQSLVTLFIVVSVVFVLMRFMPEEGFLGPNYGKMDEMQKKAILESMGLLDPIPIQLKNFYGDLLKGDLGTSIIYRPQVPVTEIIGPKIPFSLFLGWASMTISLTLGFSLGVFMARFKSGFLDKLGTIYIVIINAVPAAVYYLFLQIYGRSLLRLPMLFNPDKPISWILPIVSMALGGIAGNAMWMRRYMVDELNKDYIRLARAKGMRKSAVMFKHVMRNAIVPMVHGIPASILLVMVGSLYIESLYSVPGMGGLLIQAIQRQDTPLVQALVLIFSAFSIFGLFVGDVLMAMVDPRIKLGSKEGSR
jgi:oligopeptide transport system permease protein